MPGLDLRSPHPSGLGPRGAIAEVEGPGQAVGALAVESKISQEGLLVSIFRFHLRASVSTLGACPAAQRARVILQRLLLKFWVVVWLCA